MLGSEIGRLRLAGMLEGISFLVLLGIAMPLKYLMNYPHAVSIVGWVHGALFITYCAVLYLVHMSREWPLTKTGLFFVAAWVPFGPFLVDGRLREEEQGSSQGDFEKSQITNDKPQTNSK